MYYEYTVLTNSFSVLSHHDRVQVFNDTAPSVEGQSQQPVEGWEAYQRSS